MIYYMRHLLLGCFFALFCMNVFSEETNIELHKLKEGPSTRSLSMVPIATNDANVVHIYYSDYLLENLQITVKDLSGNTVSVSYNQPYSFILINAESGEYEIELSYGTKLFYGYFSL